MKPTPAVWPTPALHPNENMGVCRRKGSGRKEEIAVFFSEISLDIEDIQRFKNLTEQRDDKTRTTTVTEWEIEVQIGGNR